MCQYFELLCLLLNLLTLFTPVETVATIHSAIEKIRRLSSESPRLVMTVVGRYSGLLPVT